MGNEKDSLECNGSPIKIVNLISSGTMMSKYMGKTSAFKREYRAEW